MHLFAHQADPARAGMSAAGLAELRAWIERQADGGPYGCLIVRGASLAAEWYGGGFGAQSLFEIGSIRKSFNSALIGLGIEAGIVDLGARAAEWWPELVALSGDPGDAKITLHQLASAVSGWLTPDAPGTAWRYNNAAFTAAERVVARMFGLPGDEISSPEISSLVVRRFKGPLRASSWNVYHFARAFSARSGNPGPKLAIDSTLRDLVKWGQLWLNEGLWEGQSLIPGDWVSRATRPANPGLTGAHYGYNWFVNDGRSLWPGAPQDAYGHSGNGTFKPSEEPSRAYLWICPSLGLVAAIVAQVSAGFANDYLQVPQTVTAEWVGQIVRAVVWPQGASRCDADRESGRGGVK
jgi:CubicO group peptidase (beta-lactamase class C family)